MRCPVCSSKFSPRRSTHRFCSRRCSALWTAKQRGQIGIVEAVCKRCGEKFKSYAGDYRIYCSASCGHQARRTIRPLCAVCGMPVRLMRNRYCSKSCSSRARPKAGVTSMSGFYQRAHRAHPDQRPCEVCGAPGHRHHTDYRHPERVVWLCPSHHRKTHQLGKKRSEYRVRPETIRIR